jgi:hypothetical protein
VSWHFDEDGSVYLRARLPAEDGTLLVKALEAARERVRERRRAERAAAGGEPASGVDATIDVEPPRRPTTAATGHTAARPASTTWCCSATSATGSHTRAATRSSTTRRAGSLPQPLRPRLPDPAVQTTARQR